jgi:hypothetical protein
MPAAIRAAADSRHCLRCQTKACVAPKHTNSPTDTTAKHSLLKCMVSSDASSAASSASRSGRGASLARSASCWGAC